MSGVEIWVDRHDAEELSQARGRADTAKLVATFATAVAATLVATQLQVRAGHMAFWDAVAIAALSISFLLALVISGLDRLTVVDVRDVVASQTSHNLDTQQTLSALRGASYMARRINDGVLRRIQRTLIAQLTVTLIACVAAVGTTWSGVVS